jgi:hypothetical protein
MPWPPQKAHLQATSWPALEFPHIVNNANYIKCRKFALFPSSPTYTPRKAGKSQNTAIVEHFFLSYEVKTCHTNTKKPASEKAGLISFFA